MNREQVLVLLWVPLLRPPSWLAPHSQRFSGTKQPTLASSLAILNDPLASPSKYDRSYSEGPGGLLTIQLSLSAASAVSSAPDPSTESTLSN